jgi:hypothetical protein
MTDPIRFAAWVVIALAVVTVVAVMRSDQSPFIAVWAVTAALWADIARRGRND